MGALRGKTGVGRHDGWKNGGQESRWKRVKADRLRSGSSCFSL